MVFLILEIIIVAVLAWHMGVRAFDRGYSKGLFVFLTCVFWIGARFLGNLGGALLFQSKMMTMLCGWLGGMLAYTFLAFLVSRLEDRDPLNTDDSWKKRNAPNSGETEKPAEK